MPARTDQIGKILQAAEYLEARQAETLPEGFNQQQHTVELEPDPNTGNIARVSFTWQTDHYDFTVS